MLRGGLFWVLLLMGLDLEPRSCGVDFLGHGSAFMGGNVFWGWPCVSEVCGTQDRESLD